MAKPFTDTVCIKRRDTDIAAQKCIVLDPDAIILGGGVSKADISYDEGLKYISKYVFTDELLTPIIRHSLKDSAGVFGAALLAT